MARRRRWSFDVSPAATSCPASRSCVSPRAARRGNRRQSGTVESAAVRNGYLYTRLTGCSPFLAVFKLGPCWRYPGHRKGVSSSEDERTVGTPAPVTGKAEDKRQEIGAGM